MIDHSSRRRSFAGQALRVLPSQLGLLALVLLAVSSVGCRPKTQATPESQAGCVWKVTRPGGAGQLWVCGSIHVLRASDWPLAASYEEAYGQSSGLVLELPPDAAKSPQMAQSLQRLGFVAVKDKPLSGRIRPEVLKLLEQWCAKRGKDLELYQRMRPWLVALMVAMAEYDALGASAEHGVENHFEDRARADGKAAQGLESVEFQLGLFAQLDPRAEEDLLDQSLREAHAAEAQFAQMVSHWKQGDLAALHAMIHREAHQHPELFDRLIVQRNRRWAGQLGEMLQKGRRLMVLVGAGHLGGEPDGLLALLRAQGCVLETWKPKAPAPGPSSSP